MKILYFDCQSGISGNMTIAALLEIVKDDAYFLNELGKLHLNGYKISIEKTERHGIFGTYVNVILNEDKNSHPYEHRHLSNIYQIIDNSDLSSNVKNLAKKMFLNVAIAESKVHNVGLEEVHFHEVGAIDSIVDIVGTAILIDKISPDYIYANIPNEGKGYIECAHGKMMVPVPATLEIFKNHKVPFNVIDIDTELITPTGATILASLVEKFIPIFPFKILEIGYGAGSKKLSIPNMLRIIYCQLDENAEDILEIETNIDDCSGEILSFAMEKLFDAGALDVFYTPIYMKKNRPAYKLSVIAKLKDLKTMCDIIFVQTSAIGVRYTVKHRDIMPREIVTIKTKYGPLLFKKVHYATGDKIYPEFESLKKVSNEKNIPLKDLYDLVKNYEEN